MDVIIHFDSTFQGRRTITPDPCLANGPAKHTLEFALDGKQAVRIDLVKLGLTLKMGFVVESTRPEQPDAQRTLEEAL